MSAAARPGLLVSVRSAAEAEAALAGGADLIDVKEPSRGSLGRADDAVIEEVIRLVAGRRPVSAAMGDLLERIHFYPFLGKLAYIKLGFAGHDNEIPADESWQTYAFRRNIAETHLDWFVPVAYADWRRANAPEPTALCAFARQNRCGAFLLDTHAKDGSTLLDWMPFSQIALLIKQCRQVGVRIALAGSLGPKEIVALAHFKPDWFAVRGAACRGGKREEIVDADKVRELAALVRADPE